MGIELVDEQETFEVDHYSGAKFALKHWTRGMQDEVDTRCLIVNEVGGFTFNVALEREIKVTRCLASWSGISFKGEAVPCNAENIKKLPVGVFIWLVQQIDERAGIRMREDEKKN